MSAHQARIAARRGAWDNEESSFRDLVAAACGTGSWDRFQGLLGRRQGIDEMFYGRRPVRARYDSAQTSDDNRNHWSMADGLAADAANNASVRYVLRNRARYEVANNCYAAGVGLTLANDFCGTGPRLNLTTDNEKDNERVEELFNGWARAVNLARLLRVMRQARRTDGEAFGLLVSNPGIEDAVKLGIRLVEADQISSYDAVQSERHIDGILFDQYGNPIAYDILRSHPGALNANTGLQYDRWPRRYVLHWYRPTRPGQHRGIPEMLAALPLYATLRRYTQATLDAAESAADMAILLQTVAGAEFESRPTEAEPFSTVPFMRRMMVALPHGYEAKQFDPKQPTQVYSDFKREIAGEIGRCENVARNVVLLDSSDASFASGQLDYKITYRTHDIDRDDASIELLDRTFRAWLDEAALITGYLPQPFRQRDIAVPHSWHWDSNELGDILKLAKAKGENMANGLAGLPDEYSRGGREWMKALTLAARGYGITVPELQALIRTRIFAVGNAAKATPLDEQTGDEPPVPPKSSGQRAKQGAGSN